MKFNHPHMLTLLSPFQIQKKGEILKHLLLNTYDLVNKIESGQSQTWHWRVERQG